MKYEYYVIRIAVKDLEITLNKMGAKGWRAFSFENNLLILERAVVAATIELRD